MPPKHQQPMKTYVKSNTIFEASCHSLFQIIVIHKDLCFYPLAIVFMFLHDITVPGKYLL